MAKTKSTTVVDVDATRIAKYQTEFNRHYTLLGSYQTNRFDVNYRQYTAYSDTRGTDTKISDPVAPELVERVIQKMFERPPKFYALSRGHNLPQEITNIIKGTVEYMWSDPATVQSTGSAREKLKESGREFCVTGQTCTETYYNAESDAPDFRIIPIEDVVFDSTTTLKKSSFYYIRQYVTMEYLEDHREIDVNGKILGRFKNIDQFKAAHEGAPTVRQDPSPYLVNRSGPQTQQRPVGDILLISRWEGKHCVRMVEWTSIIEEFNNDILNDDPLDFAMDIVVPKQPYAFGLLDFLNGLTHAKDMILNQVVDYGSKALNPPLFVDPSVAANPVNKQSLRNAYKLGGIVLANPAMVNHLPMPTLPTFGFDMLNYAQQRLESATGIAGYSSTAIPNSNDKVKGTATGINALQAQAISPIHDRQINFEEAIIEPVTNKMLKYMAALMAKNEEKFVFVTGESPHWVTVTKNLIQGKITLADLIVSGLVSMQPDPQTGVSPAQELAKAMLAQGKKPQSHVLFDITWVVRCETGSMAEQDSEKDVANLQAWADFRLQFRIPTDLKKISEEMGLRMGIKDPSQYDLEQPTGPGQQPIHNASTLPYILPHETMNFSDMPPDGKMQMAGNAGLNLNPQGLMGSPLPPDKAAYAHTPQDYMSGLPPQEQQQMMQPQQQQPMMGNNAPGMPPQGQPGQQMGPLIPQNGVQNGVPNGNFAPNPMQGPGQAPQQPNMMSAPNSLPQLPGLPTKKKKKVGV